MCGTLIYTGSSDSEGTLGGLSKLAETSKINSIVERALIKSQWCSFDPVCKESNLVEPNQIKLASCHSCVNISETSCELFNKITDRTMLTDENYGFFSDCF